MISETEQTVHLVRKLSLLGVRPTPNLECHLRLDPLLEGILGPALILGRQLVHSYSSHEREFDKPVFIMSAGVDICKSDDGTSVTVEVDPADAFLAAARLSFSLMGGVDGSPMLVRMEVGDETWEARLDKPVWERFFIADPAQQAAAPRLYYQT
jgi:hypothetical protein